VGQAADTIVHARTSVAETQPPATGTALAERGAVTLSVHDDLASVEPIWRRFQETADCTPFQTFDWLYETSLGFNHFLVHQLNARLGQFIALVETGRIQSTTAQVAFCVAQLLNPALCSATSDVLHISQDEIARLCGLSRQIANRALHALQLAGLVRTQYGAIQVLDIDGLHAFGKGVKPKLHSALPMACGAHPL